MGRVRAFRASGRLLEDVTFERQNKQNSDFRQYTLNNVTFEATNVSGSNFSGATLNGVNFHIRHDTGLASSEIDKYFSNLNFSNVVWNGGSISGQTDVSSGSSTTTYRVNINLYNANFKDAVLNKVAFQSVNFDSNCTFENADLYGSSFFVVDLHDSTFQNAKIAGAEFIDSGFNKTMLQSTASYKNKDLQGLFLASNGGPIDFSGVDFSGVNLREATFMQVNLSGANFTSADLRGSMMFGDTSGAIYKNTVTIS